MGGTSTDVCRYAGALERRDTARRWPACRLRAPMLDVETVAAGGGSILAFDGLRARVGPASAGADPGPAAYGRGGPATVTDANLVLGRLDPARLSRRVRAPTATRRWMPAAARARLAELAAAMGAASVEAAAEGFVAVAVEQMAGAIRRISTERGFDPRDHALVAFGGAAGQVACQVAEALGDRRGAVPALRQPAFGLGHRPGPDARRCARPAWSNRWTRDGLAAARTPLRWSGGRGAPRPGRPGRSGWRHRCGVCACSYAEADAALPAAAGALEDVQAAFEAAHRRLFGFVEPGGAILIASVEVEALEADAEPPPPPSGVLPPQGDEVAYLLAPWSTGEAPLLPPRGGGPRRGGGGRRNTCSRRRHRPARRGPALIVRGDTQIGWPPAGGPNRATPD